MTGPNVGALRETQTGGTPTVASTRSRKKGLDNGTPYL
jgi:hypothetical protein